MAFSECASGYESPAPMLPPQPYSARPTLALDFDSDSVLAPDISGFDLSDQSDPIESISPFQTTTLSVALEQDGQERLAEERQTELPLHSHNCSSRTSPSCLSAGNQSKTSEMRLCGVVSSVKSLESALKTKETAIKSLEAEIEYKESVIEALQGEVGSSGRTEEKEKRAVSTLNLLMRRKEREQEKRILELEERAKDAQRTISRLKFLNKQLLTTAEQPPPQCVSSLSDNPPTSRRLNSELQRLRVVNATLTQKLSEYEERISQTAEKHNALVSLYRDFEAACSQLALNTSMLSQDLQRLLS